MYSNGDPSTRCCILSQSDGRTNQMSFLEGISVFSRWQHLKAAPSSPRAVPAVPLLVSVVLLQLIGQTRITAPDGLHSVLHLVVLTLRQGISGLQTKVLV